MNTRSGFPEAVCVTIETFEKLISMDERRRKELLAEIAALRVRERVIGATQDAGWVTARFIEPRMAELRAVDGRIALIQEKLAKLVEQWSKPRPRQNHVWVETGEPSMLALMA